MAISIRCSSCGRLGHVPDEAAGRKTRCPACQTVIPVPAIPAAELFEDDDLEPLASSEPKSAVSARSASPPSSKSASAEFIPLDAPAKPAPKATLKPLSSSKPRPTAARDEELELDDAPPQRSAPRSQLTPMSGGKKGGGGRLFDDLESDDLGEDHDDEPRMASPPRASRGGEKTDTVTPIVLAIGGGALAITVLIGLFTLISKMSSQSEPANDNATANASAPNSSPAPNPVTAPAPNGYPGASATAAPAPPTPPAPAVAPPPSSFAANDQNRLDAQAKNFNAGSFDGADSGAVGPNSRPSRSSRPGANASETPRIDKADWNFAADPAPAVPEALTTIDPKLTIAVPSGTAVKSAVIFPSTPSPFVMVGGSRHIDQEWNTVDLTTGKSIGKMTGKVAVHSPIALHPDGTLAAMAMGNFVESGVGVFETKRGKQVGLIPTGREQAKFLEFGPGATLAFMTDQSAQVWDYKTKKRIGAIGLEHNPFRKSGCAISGGRQHFAIADKSSIKIMNVQTGEVEGQHEIQPSKPGHSPEVLALAFSPDGEFLSALTKVFAGALELRTWSRQGAPESAYALSGLDADQHFRALTDEQKGTDLAWLADGSGWFAMRQAIVERKSGQTVWSLPFDRDGELIAGPRQVIHNGLAMVPHKIGEQIDLRAHVLPKDQIANGLKLASKGEDPTDAALPAPIKTDLSAAPKVAPVATIAWTAKPDPAPPAPVYASNGIPLTARWGEVEHILFSSPTTGKALVTSLPSVAVWMKAPGEARKEATSRRIERIDLKTGVRDNGFEFAAAFEAIAFSPNGERFLTWDAARQSRIDVHNAQSGSHLVGLRPYEGLTGLGQQIAWADFLDDNRVLTLNTGGILALWSIPDGKAIYQSEIRTTENVLLSPGRNAIAFADRNRIVIANAATGEIQGAMDLGIGSDPGSKGFAMAFRSDGAEAAVAANRKLTVIDVASGQIKAVYPLQIFEIKSLQYCGPYFALINGDQLFDFVKKSQIWQYQGMVQHAKTSPSNAHWYVGRGAGFEGAKLGSLPIPDPALTLSLQLFADPKTQASLRSGQSVGLRMEMNGVAGDAGAMQKAIESSFAARCAAFGLTYNANAPTRYVVRISERATGKNREYRMMGMGMMRGGPQVLSIPDRLLDCELLLEDERGPISLLKSSFDTPFFASVKGNDQGSIDNELREQLWRSGQSWASGVSIPYFVMRTANKPLTLPGLSPFPDL